MTGADKIVCQAATLLVLFALTLTPAKAQFGGGGGGQDMMTQMAPMLEMMKARMGKRRFAMMMQTMGPMMGRMMEGGGGGYGGNISPEGYGGTVGGFGGGNIMGMLGGAGGGDMMSMIPHLMRMANVGDGRHGRRSPAPVGIRHSGMVRRTRPGISRFRVRCFASPRNDSIRTTPDEPWQGDRASVPIASGPRSRRTARRAKPWMRPPARRIARPSHHASTATSRRCR